MVSISELSRLKLVFVAKQIGFVTNLCPTLFVSNQLANPKTCDAAHKTKFTFSRPGSRFLCLKSASQEFHQWLSNGIL